MTRKTDIKGLFYITHLENLPSIIHHGILSHGEIETRGIDFKAIYDTAIVSNRKSKVTPDGKSLWQYANLYFQPRNPMMYRVVHEKGYRELAVIGVKPDILGRDDILVTDGNAASGPTEFFRVPQGLSAIQSQWRILHAEYWNDRDGSKRKIMAECLVPGKVNTDQVHTIFVADQDTKKQAEQLLRPSRVPVVPEPHMFFRPRFAARVGKTISLVDGDMFFSDMQTLTVSVNLQGIMGKGLASRAKYQFPDVYVVYQDACRAKRITATKPFLYKREASLDEELADPGSPLSTLNSVKWFLLFATKRKWRENSRIEDIEGGLTWLRDNFAGEGISSLAIPALGCGLGGLDWADVGPIMCRHLHDLDMPVAIYLPRERQIDPRFLRTPYLLGHDC